MIVEIPRYGPFNRAVREALPKAQKREIDVWLQRAGVGFSGRRRVIKILSAFTLGVKQGIKEARNG